MKNTVRSFPSQFIINSLFALVFVTCAFGYNRFNRSIDIGDGFASLASVFGGFTSFLALIGLVALGAVIWWTVTAIADSDRYKNAYAGGLALVYVVVAVVAGNQWLDVPGGISLIILGFVLVTALQTWLNRRLSA